MTAAAKAAGILLALTLVAVGAAYIGLRIFAAGIEQTAGDDDDYF